jgi:hypothetical protein
MRFMHRTVEGIVGEISLQVIKVDDFFRDQIAGNSNEFRMGEIGSQVKVR